MKWLAPIEWMHIFLAVAVTGTVWILWRIQKATNGIKFEKLVIDKDGDPDWTKMSAIGAWFIAAYVVVHSELAGRVVDGMNVTLLLFAGIYTLNRSAMVILNRLYPGTPSAIPDTGVGK